MVVGISSATSNMNKMIECNILKSYFEEHPLYKSDEAKMQPDKGIQQSYKNVAHSAANVMFRAKLKGETHLDETIPLHMTLKTFDKPEALPLDQIKSKAEELDIQRPDPHSLQYEPITFTSPRNGNTYYMLKISGTHPSLEQFNEHFKGQGITHDKFMAHITINKDLYDRIKTEGIKPHEVEFSPLMIEHGAGNTTHIFQDNQSHKDHLSEITPKYKDPKKLAASEDFGDLQKGKVTNAIAGAAMAIGIANAVPSGKASIGPIDHQPKAGSHEVEPNSPHPSYDRGHMLRTIAQVESSGGIDTDHVELGGMHAGERAFGKYGLTPVVIRETIKMNRELKDKHGKAAMLEGNDLVHYLHDNPGLEDQVAEKHIARLEHHFGGNASEIGYAWLNGVTGTYKAKKQNKNLDDHWHVKKIKAAYKRDQTPIKTAKN